MLSLCACARACVQERDRETESRAISKKVFLQLTQAFANRRERRNALYRVRMHVHKATEERGRKKRSGGGLVGVGGGGVMHYAGREVTGV